MGRHFSKLEGKKVDVVFGTTTYHGVVTGSDYSLGLTIQEERTKRYLLCANGPKSPVMKGRKYNSKMHKTSMTFCYDRIMSGAPIIGSELTQIVREATGTSFGGSPSAATCAFSQ